MSKWWLRAVAVFAWLLALPAAAGEKVDLEAQLQLLERGELPALRIPGARYRVGVFEFDDPDGTGLGNSVATLLSREILLGSRVRSIGVLQFVGGLSPSASMQLSYFDKVDKVAEAQQVTVAIWGRIQRTGASIRIETYLQLPPSTLERAFTWRVRFTPETSVEPLVARLRPDRLLLQSKTVSASETDAISDAARRLDQLHEERRDDARVKAVLPIGKVYWVKTRDGDWTELDAGGDTVGWVRTSGGCAGECASLLEASRFAGDLLRFMETRAVPDTRVGLSEDARAVADQLSALEGLGGRRAEEIRARSLEVADRWLGAARAERRVPPGGAAFANLHALAEIVIALKLSAREVGDNARLPTGTARDVAYRLADASLNDPANAEVLHNLALLFEYAGDRPRAELARKLAAQSTVR